MAHYAKIDENNVVERVEKLDDFYEWTDTGELSEQNAIAYLRKIWGESTNWVKTSYNANIRGNHLFLCPLLTKNVHGSGMKNYKNGMKNYNEKTL